MSSILTATGKHRADDRITELEAKVRDLEATIEELTCELTRTLLRGMQDATALADASTKIEALVARVKELGDKVIRAGAEHARLRQAVINARPRIDVTVQRLDRPYVSYVQIPYPVPVQPRNTSNDDTQAIPLIDLPQPAAI